jgi:hypothetical protein
MAEIACKRFPMTAEPGAGVAFGFTGDSFSNGKVREISNLTLCSKHGVWIMQQKFFVLGVPVFARKIPSGMWRNAYLRSVTSAVVTAIA